jgi:hypothetical protein
MDYNQKVVNDQSKNLGIDFDGVIHNDNLGFHDGTVYGEPIEGSLESIKLLSEFFNIIIFTAKAKKDRPLIDGKSGAELVEEWLLKHNVLKYISEITAEKPRALLYVDDKGFRFENWQDTMKFIKSISEI